jgi:hypothetical protein
MRPLRRIGEWNTSGVSAGRPAQLSLPETRRKNPGGDICAPLALGFLINDDLAGEPAPVCRKGEWRGYREGASGLSHDRLTGSRPEHFEMVAAIPSLSNIFLHVGQGVEKSGGNGRREPPRRGGKCGSVAGLVL